MQRGWSATMGGLVTTVAGLVGVALQVPFGMAVDAVRDKRLAIVAALVFASVGAAIIAIWPRFWPVLAAFALLTAAGSAFTPTVAGLTLGMVPKGRLAGRMGRNSAWYRGGSASSPC